MVHTMQSPTKNHRDRTLLVHLTPGGPARPSYHRSSRCRGSFAGPHSSWTCKGGRRRRSPQAKTYPPSPTITEGARAYCLSSQLKPDHPYEKSGPYQYGWCGGGGVRIESWKGAPAVLKFPRNIGQPRRKWEGGGGVAGAHVSCSRVTIWRCWGEEDMEKTSGKFEWTMSTI